MAEKVKDFFTFYFIESHLKDIGNAEIIIESSYKCLSPIRKIMEKEFKDKKKEVFIISVYGIDFKPSLIKKKEIKEMNKIQALLIKICLKIEKNKFESEFYINTTKDIFHPNVKFEMEKKVFGKDIPPPIKYELSNLEIIQIFNDALVMKERKKNNDPTFIELIRYGYNLIVQMKSIELVLYLMIYVNILNGNDLKLIKGIFDIFQLEKLTRPLKPNDLAIYHEKLDILYNEQVQIFEKIKNVDKFDLQVYLEKFYTIYLYAFYIVENYESCQHILTDLRDNNPFDKLILPKLYLSGYNLFYRNIPITDDLKNSLMGKFIDTSKNYSELLTSFSYIKEYVKKDFITVLLIINDNFPKIHELCYKRNLPLKINDYIEQNQNDDLSKIQYHLDIIVQKKLENNFKTIDFDINMWDFYISNNNNKNFWEYLKSKLIIASLNYNDILAALSYIIKYTNKDFIEMLDLLIINYDKIRFICMKEKKSINISDFIVQNLNDNKDKLKECLNFIISEKLKDQYETILFHINIWNYYVFNKYQLDFLTFLEINLYKQAINSKDICDCIEFSSNFRSKSFSSLLEIIKYNFDQIQNILKNENTNINIEKYIYQQPQSDDLLKIKELVKAIIEKELLSLHCSIIFNENIWVPYIQTNDLNILRLIRIIFYECKKMQPTLNEDVIALPKKIHDAGFNEIQKGILINNKMLEFLGNEEAFYVDKQINTCQAQANNNTLEINNLKVENMNLKQQLNNANASIVNLGKENTLLRNTINNLQTQINTLSREFTDVTARCSKLESKVRSLEWRS